MQIKENKVLKRISGLFLLTISFGFFNPQNLLGLIISWVHLNVFSFEIFYLNCFFISLLMLKEKKYKHVFVLCFFVILTVSLHALTGSRNAPIIAIVMYFCVAFSLLRSYKISLKSIIICVGILTLCIFNFFLSQAIRESLGDKNRLNPFEISRVEPLLLSDRAGDNLSKAFERVGYLDIASEIIWNKELYKPIFCLSYYFKSIIDNSNLLTPGFDFFDNPSVACGLRFIYDYQENLSRKYSRENYHSDQVTFFAEAFALFGYLYGFLYIFFVVFLFSFSYNKISSVRLKSLLAFAFYIFLNNYGLDTVIVYSASLFVSNLFYSICFLPESIIRE